MTNQTSAPSPAPAETQSTPSPDDSLKAIASEFTVEEQARQFTATPSHPAQFQPQAYQPPVQHVPDPVVDKDAYVAWANAQLAAQNQFQSALREVTTEISAIKQERIQQKVNADVDRAVQTVGQTLKGVDPDLIESFLNLEYSKNPSFQRIFDNRDKNPTAYERALKVVADKYASKVQIKVDPRLAENVRAAQSSQRTMATTQSPSNEWANLSPKEFEEMWLRTKRGF